MLPCTALVDPLDDRSRLLGPVAIAVAVASTCLAYAYGVNGVADRGMDFEDTKNALVGVDGFPREAALLLAGCAALALGLAALLGHEAILATACSLLAGTVYSAPPRLKRLPVVGTLANVGIFAPLPMLASGLSPSLSEMGLEYAFCILLTQNQLLHEVSDLAEDLRGGVRTTGAWLGRRGMRVAALLLGPIAAVGALNLPLRREVNGLSALAIVTCAGLLVVSDEGSASRWRVRHRFMALGFGVALFALLVARRG